jgi:hypothetical protein
MSTDTLHVFGPGSQTIHTPLVRTTKCLEVIVKFVNPSHHAQEIRVTHGPTATRYLRIEQTVEALMVHFCDKDNDSIKTVNFNYSQVREWMTEGYVR